MPGLRLYETMTYAATVMRLSGLLYSHFGGSYCNWDATADGLLRNCPRTRKAAMWFFYSERLPVELAEKVWTFIQEIRRVT